MEITRVPLSSLVLDPKNARQHGDRNLETIKGSLNAFGQVENLVVQKSTMKVIGGNGRVAAMRARGDTHAHVVMLDINDVEAAKLGLALNRTAELAAWDKDNLGDIVGMLQKAGIDIDDVGFNDDEIMDLLGKEDPVSAADVDEDSIPEPPPEPITQKGDLWLLGGHRLLCGDSTKAESVARLMGGAYADAVVTDPPYGVSYVGKTKDALKIQNDGAEGLLELLSLALKNVHDNTRKGAVWYVWAPPGPQFLDFAVVLKDLAVWRQTIVWVKNSLVMGHSDYHYRHEVCFYGWTDGHAHQQPPDRKQDTVWEVDRPTKNKDHPTMKPVQLIAKCLENSTAKGNIILEPFGGSGTTLIASEQMGRKCYAIELEPKYCDVIVSRWEKLTGQKAQRISGDS